MRKRNLLLNQRIVEELRKNTQYLNIIDIGIARLESKLDEIDKKLSSILNKRRRAKKKNEKQHEKK
jgi:hypothetical protein